ncbi:forespore capture DNA-binding protein RefZ [Metabacillus sediminilitoris]|jgi:AcrR family transcriptional regulator|uniref:TetR/AcrR family transcriptional regulator n=1 Tax=Metabacillus sediminilitoris TaxID=2567941 RepID=A0A4S4C484_9BACI|nr:forespore capture DNA-binding protein RefZ [Metabacillus sediminilitoris]QGQ47533.1 forespore capture DNA-binding protein RefZ [Metabacillus sediminilitoris]THF81967.1 TetR/AcrR family transcriptional regulator [Metabacillus sediminilitoris]
MTQQSLRDTKQKILHAAMYLFNSKGYNGTSVREIASRANVNVAHISYYFKGKGGLLEYLISQYYEGYLEVIEKNHSQLNFGNAHNILSKMILDILNYQHENRQLSRLVYREVTLDSVLIREVMTTYLTKEKYFIKSVIDQGIQEGYYRKGIVSHMIIQLRSLLHMPYLQPQYMSEVLHIQPHEAYFVHQYYKELKFWLNTLRVENHSLDGKLLAIR